MDIREDSMAVARMTNKLVPTVLTMGASGLMTRKVDIYSAATFAQRGEDDEISPQKFAKNAKSSITPAQYGGAFRITDARASSDFDPVLADAAFELGGAAAKHIDVNLATLFSSVTGGTIGSGATDTAAWSDITKALAILENQDVPPGLPRYCALHPYQWERLLSSVTPAGASVAVAPAFQDRVTAGGFFQSPAYHQLTFVITNAIAISGTAATGCVYVPQAFALDTRKAFTIEPKRIQEREASDLYATFWYGYGTWRPEWAVALSLDAATPS
jgi:hypothetical protein